MYRLAFNHGKRKMKTGPLAPVSRKAMVGMDRISKILAKVPQEEWEFVLKQAKSTADARVATKEIKTWARKQLKHQKRK